VASHLTDTPVLDCAHRSTSLDGVAVQRIDDETGYQQSCSDQPPPRQADHAILQLWSINFPSFVPICLRHKYKIDVIMR
jgi:hypothetical protein